MRRREFITVIGGAAAWPPAAWAQQPAMPVIGLLQLGSPEALANRVGAFRKGLSESGYIEGQNVAIEFRWAHNDVERLPKLAADLVRRRVSLIATPFSMPAALAAKSATTTIPIVFSAAGDPVQTGLVTSLNRPGGNVTGITDFGVALAGKRLELLRQLVPKAARIAVLANPADVAATYTQSREVEATARSMGLQVQFHNANNSKEIDVAFEAIGREKPDAVFISVTPFFNGRRIQLVQLAAFHRLTATYGLRDYAEAGGLMSYGSNIVDAYRQVGIYAGRILKGTRPADLPVVQSNKFELIINAQTARMLGLAVPASLLAIADEVIE